MLLIQLIYSSNRQKVKVLVFTKVKKSQKRALLMILLIIMPERKCYGIICPELTIMTS